MVTVVIVASESVGGKADAFNEPHGVVKWSSQVVVDLSLVVALHAQSVALDAIALVAQVIFAVRIIGHHNSSLTVA